LTYEIICSKCGHTIYSGIDLKSPHDVLKGAENRCRKCGVKLSLGNFKVDIKRLEGPFV
jgi:DNA-directed RNA polymerase subunit RPC12/RpoP